MSRSKPSATVLRRMNFFSGMPEEHLRLVAGVARQRRFRGGQLVLEENSAADTSPRAAEPTSLLEISRDDFKVLLVQAYLDKVHAVVNTLEARDPYTRGHTGRVTTIAKAIAGRMRLSEEDLFILEIGALLHDVGKIGVTDAILRKPGPLDLREYEQIREHPDKGRQILSDISFLQKVIPCVLHHHERYDGAGYPQRLSGADIPLLGRIIAVADAFDAMTSDRPYRRSMRHSNALAELRRGAGKQFDPKVVQAFLAVWSRGRLAASLQRAPGAAAAG